VLLALRLAVVEKASVDVAPTNVCECDIPGHFGKTIGSSGATWLTEQSTWNSWKPTWAAWGNVEGRSGGHSAGVTVIDSPGPRLGGKGATAELAIGPADVVVVVAAAGATTPAAMATLAVVDVVAASPAGEVDGVVVLVPSTAAADASAPLVRLGLVEPLVKETVPASATPTVAKTVPVARKSAAVRFASTRSR
jgi:hypothetical protein